MMNEVSIYSFVSEDNVQYIYEHQHPYLRFEHLPQKRTVPSLRKTKAYSFPNHIVILEY